MFPHATRVFSQEAELSQFPQLECLSNNENGSNNIAQQQRQEMLGYSQEFDITRASVCQEQVSQDQLSSRADAICEENRLVTNLGQSRLKELERRRINLVNKKSKIIQEEKDYLEIHDCRLRELIDLQMSLEEMTMQFKNEYEQRPKLLEKQKNVQLLISTFETHNTEGLKTTEVIKKEMTNLKYEMEKTHNHLKTLNLKMSEKKLIFKKDMEQKTIIKAQDYNEGIVRDRENFISEIKKYDHQNMEMKNTNKRLGDKLSNVLKRNEELSNTLNAISLQIKMHSEAITELRCSLDKCRAVGASDLQNLKLQINTEHYNNTNLAEKLKEKEEYYNSLLKQEKESNNLMHQIKMANENALKSNKEKQVEIEEVGVQNTKISELTNNIAEGIHQYVNSEEENKSFKEAILRLEEDIKSCKVCLKDKEDLVNKLKVQVEESKRILFSLKENNSQSCNTLEHAKLIKTDIVSKEKEENIVFQQERASKMAHCNNMEQENINIACKENEMHMSIVKLREFNNSLKTYIKEIEMSIENYIRDAEESEKKLFVNIEENEEELEYLKKEIDENNIRLETYEESLSETLHKRDELIQIKAQKEALEKDLHDQNGRFKIEKESLVNNFNSKALELGREIENFTSVMKGILNCEDEKTEQFTVEIQETKKTEMEVKNECNKLYKLLVTLRNHMTRRREQVAKNEKRLVMINNEIKVTKQDLTDVITGNMQPPVAVQSSKKQVMPTSSLEPFRIQNTCEQPPAKKMAYSKELIPNFSNMVDTRKWVESVPVDEYDFSEI